MRGCLDRQEPAFRLGATSLRKEMLHCVAHMSTTKHSRVCALLCGAAVSIRAECIVWCQSRKERSILPRTADKAPLDVPSLWAKSCRNKLQATGVTSVPPHCVLRASTRAAPASPTTESSHGPLLGVPDQPVERENKDQRHRHRKVPQLSLFPPSRFWRKLFAPFKSYEELR